MKLDRENKEPLRQQLKTVLFNLIDDQVWKPGDRLPSEGKLCDMYGVSRMTVRSTLSDLEKEGIIQKKQGVGSFVSSGKITQPLHQLRSFSQDMKDRGLKPKSRILMFESIPASNMVAEKLQIPTGSEVIILKRLRMADDEPMAIETAYLSFRLCMPLLNRLNDSDSLYQLIREELGIKLEFAQQSIEVASVSGWEASLLGMAENAQILLIERLSFTDSAIPIEYVNSKYRGDRYKFYINLQVITT